MTQQHEAELTLGDCHFCQSSALKIWGPDSRTGMSHVTCDNCGARGPLRGSAKMAAAEWAKPVPHHNSPQVPDGYALAPLYPTRAMFDAGASVLKPVVAGSYDLAHETYRAMLAAAPSITEPGEAI